MTAEKPQSAHICAHLPTFPWSKVNAKVTIVAVTSAGQQNAHTHHTPQNRRTPMTNFIEKARLGRASALAARPAGHDAGSRIRSLSRHEHVTFISSRARAAAQAFQA
jgi:hypothetical protein